MMKRKLQKDLFVVILKIKHNKNRRKNDEEEEEKKCRKTKGKMERVSVTDKRQPPIDYSL